MTIIIPTFNRATLLGDALRSVCALALPRAVSAECIIVDNNSSDDTRAVVQAAAAQQQTICVRYVMEPQQGLNHARNRGLSESSGVWTVFLDDDMVVAPEWLTAFVSATAATAADIVTGPVEPMFEGPPPPWCVPKVLDSVTSSYSRRGDTVRVLTGAERHEMPGCNFAVRTDWGRRVGGFHGELDRAGAGMLAGGDFEFAMRVAQSGGAALYVPGCRIRHLVSNKKMSRSGLLARWRGLGATERRIREIHDLSPRLTPLRARARILRFRLRSWLLGLMGREDAFHWRLEAELLKHTL